ncbi:hypothetical protein BC835DRAFT_1311621 [Cytidiella melzeri]|nr:hypothetical protein BC835DRAFT_1311621 [Cytidiella melzeri]
MPSRALLHEEYKMSTARVAHSASGSTTVRVRGVLHLAHFFFPLKWLVNIAAGAGDSPRNDIIREALQILLSDGSLWQSREGYMAPNWHLSSTPIPYRVILFRAAGTLLMLHLVWVGAPLPVSPFLPLLLLDGPASFDFDPIFLKDHISATALDGLRHWDSLRPDEVVPDGYLNPVGALFMDANANVIISLTIFLLMFAHKINQQLSVLSSYRTDAERNAVARSLLMSRTLGTTRPHLELDYAAIVQGANVPLDAHKEVTQHAFLLSDNGPLATYRSFKSLLTRAYNRRVRQPSDLTSRIKFTQRRFGVPERGSNSEPVVLDRLHELEPFRKAFEEQLNSFLNTVGYTPFVLEIRPTLPAQYPEKDPCTRSRLLLRAATGSDLLPLQDDMEAIRFNIVHHLPVPVVDPPPQRDSLARAIEFHACLRYATVHMDDDLRYILANPQLGCVFEAIYDVYANLLVLCLMLNTAGALNCKLHHDQITRWWLADMLRCIELWAVPAPGGFNGLCSGSFTLILKHPVNLAMWFWILLSEVHA